MDVAQLNLLRECAVSALACERASGVPCELTLAQWALESGWGQHMPGNNCLSGDTKVLSKQGLVAIKSLVGPLELFGSNRVWNDAVIMCYGEQETHEIIIRRGLNRTQRVRATLEHRWPLLSGQIKTTSQLCRGDSLQLLRPSRGPYFSPDYRSGVIHGIVYGDGYLDHYKKTRCYRIRVCSDARDLLPYFEGFQISRPRSMDHDPFIKIPAYGNLKELPPISMGEEYLVGFFRGWMAADGCVPDSSDSPSICCGSLEEGWLLSNMTPFGYFFSGSTVLNSQTNYGPRKKDSRNLRIERFSLDPDDFIIKRKRDRFSYYYRPLTLDVKSVEGVAKKEEVYCATVPATSDFVIDRGLLTGNCFGIKGDHTGQLLGTTEWFGAGGADKWVAAKQGRIALLLDGVAADPKGRRKYSCKDWFRKYETVADCFIDHASIFQTGLLGNFLGTYRMDGNLVNFTQNIAPVYATDPDYSRKVLSIMSMPEVQAAIIDARRTS